MLTNWVLAKLEAVADRDRIVLRDSLRLLPEADGRINSFAQEHGFTVIIASTNLVFRELYEAAIADADTKQLLVIDRAPARRRGSPSTTKAPPPFYPDLLDRTSPQARIEVDLRQFLRETTGDPSWPLEANDPRYARLISRHLNAVINAHETLRKADTSRFTDHDFKKIVAFSALGVADSAFKKLDAEDYWKIGLIGHDDLAELDSLAPEVTKLIKDEMRKAPPPFCRFADHDPEVVIRAFYLSAILSQHTDLWNLLLANIDPSLGSLSDIKPETLADSAPKLIAMDSELADRDLQSVEDSLSRETLGLIVVDHLKLNEPKGFADVIEKERYSTLIRSLALLLAMDNLLSIQSNLEIHERIHEVLFTQGQHPEIPFVDRRPGKTWSDLKEAYRLATSVQQLRSELAGAVKSLKVAKSSELTFAVFYDLWNTRRANRLEYWLSALERLIDCAEILPRPEDELPTAFRDARNRIRHSIVSITDDVGRQLDVLNQYFQKMVSLQYPEWVAKDSEVRLTSQFLRRCLKPNWDPQTEEAVVLVFDGMRYEIWDEFLRPLLEDRMELIEELHASALLPSETHISRKAICAGTYPDEFDMSAGEDKLLKEGLSSLVSSSGEVKTVAPQGSGTGETVRYRAGNLQVYIFELCDKELHKVKMKTLPDGRERPSRPLSFIYTQLVKNIIDTEVMAIIRNLKPGTKLFVVADHGFGRVGREALWFDEGDLNEVSDCSYLNCFLKVPFDSAFLPQKTQDNMIVFTPQQLRMPAEEKRTMKKSGKVFTKQYQSIVFPRVGYSFSRQGSPYNPDVYSHGGISIQEMMIPMAVLRVRDKDEGFLVLDEISGPQEVVEGQDAEFRLRVGYGGKAVPAQGEVRIDIQAYYARDPDRDPLRNQVLYVPAQGSEIVYSFRPETDDATDEERQKGEMERDLTIAVSYSDGQRIIRQSRPHRFAVRLNLERVARRVPPHLGNILGLTPKSMR